MQRWGYLTQTLRTLKDFLSTVVDLSGDGLETELIMLCMMAAQRVDFNLTTENTEIMEITPRTVVPSGLPQGGKPRNPSDRWGLKP